MFLIDWEDMFLDIVTDKVSRRVRGSNKNNSIDLKTEYILSESKLSGAQRGVSAKRGKVGWDAGEHMFARQG